MVLNGFPLFEFNRNCVLDCCLNGDDFSGVFVSSLQNAGEFSFYNNLNCDICFVFNMFLCFKTAGPAIKEA